MYLKANATEIKKKRTLSGFSQRQLSLKAELNGNTIFRIESGETSLTHHLRAREIARALDCKVSDIFEVPTK